VIRASVEMGQRRFGLKGGSEGKNEVKVSLIFRAMVKVRGRRQVDPNSRQGGFLLKTPKGQR
jgi:hypothetical protein